MRAYGLPENTSYSDIEKIRRELAFANDLYQKLGCIVIDVASLSIEETASMILNALNLEDHSYYSTETSRIKREKITSDFSRFKRLEHLLDQY